MSSTKFKRYDYVMNKITKQEEIYRIVAIDLHEAALVDESEEGMDSLFKMKLYNLNRDYISVDPGFVKLLYENEEKEN